MGQFLASPISTFLWFGPSKAVVPLTGITLVASMFIETRSYRRATIASLLFVWLLSGFLAVAGSY